MIPVKNNESRSRIFQETTKKNEENKTIDVFPEIYFNSVPKFTPSTINRNSSSTSASAFATSSLHLGTYRPLFPDEIPDPPKKRSFSNLTEESNTLKKIQDQAFPPLSPPSDHFYTKYGYSDSFSPPKRKSSNIDDPKDASPNQTTNQSSSSALESLPYLDINPSSNSSVERSGSPPPSAQKTISLCCPSIREEKEQRTATKLLEEWIVQEHFYKGKNISITKEIGRGEHSVAFEITIPSSTSEERHVLKKPLRTNNLTKFYKLPMLQYADLKDRSPNRKNPLDDDFFVPYVPILNYESYKTDGFLLQEKINVFSKAPWAEDQKVEDFDRKTKSYLDQVTDLYIHSLFSAKPLLDLRWSNLGILPKDSEQETPVIHLLDFYEGDEDDTMCVHAETYLDLISERNRHVRKFILDKAINLYSELIKGNLESTSMQDTSLIWNRISRLSGLDPTY